MLQYVFPKNKDAHWYKPQYNEQSQEIKHYLIYPYYRIHSPYMDFAN